MAATSEVEIDRNEDHDRYRYTCPNGHTTWDRTNNHIWCPSCAEHAHHDNEIDPEHYELLDKKTGESIPWEAVSIETDE